MALSTLAEEGYPFLLEALLGNLVCYCRLYTNDPVLNPSRVAADFVEPVYTGYAAIAVERWTPVTLRAGIAWATAMPVSFVWTVGPAPTPIRGAYVVSSPGGKLLWAWRRPGDAYPLGPDHAILTVYARATFPLKCE